MAEYQFLTQDEAYETLISMGRDEEAASVLSSQCDFFYQTNMDGEQQLYVKYDLGDGENE